MRVSSALMGNSWSSMQAEAIMFCLRGWAV